MMHRQQGDSELHRIVHMFFEYNSLRLFTPGFFNELLKLGYGLF